ncbi:unnamed protein product, partial [Amoebophrya sp. A120]
GRKSKGLVGGRKKVNMISVQSLGSAEKKRVVRCRRFRKNLLSAKGTTTSGGHNDNKWRQRAGSLLERQSAIFRKDQHQAQDFAPKQLIYTAGRKNAGSPRRSKTPTLFSPPHREALRVSDFGYSTTVP